MLIPSSPSTNPIPNALDAQYSLIPDRAFENPLFFPPPFTRAQTWAGRCSQLEACTIMNRTNERYRLLTHWGDTTESLALWDRGR